MALKYVEGDLIEMALKRKFDVIVHGCNCFCNMGKGIALQIAKTFLKAYLADMSTCKGDRKKLGTIGIIIDLGVTVVNAYTQYGYGRMTRNKPNADYKAIRSCMIKIREEVLTINPDYKIGFPLIGAGLAGGDWAIIEKIIEEELGNFNITIVRFVK